MAALVRGRVRGLRGLMMHLAVTGIAVTLVGYEMALDGSGVGVVIGVQPDPTRADLNMLGVSASGAERQRGAHEHAREK
ncbi:MAG: hypothetical protein WAP03_04740 [Methylorubrum rhodinum]|jgi:hypothetical protein|uniref:hypothetical protein n=1 Tax=Methylorubrum rhodinum TaxID=29428 RepID=UPI003BB20BC3